MSKQEPLHVLIAEHIRQNAPRALAPAQIASGLINSRPERFALKLRGFNGDKNALHDQLTREIYGQWRQILEKYPDLTVDRSKSPMTFMPAAAATSSNLADINDSGPDQTDDGEAPNIQEKELYPLLREFLAVERGMVSKRIREGTSSNRRGRNGNKWLHPDIVAMEPIGQEWLAEVRGGANLLQTKRCRLVSLEVKLALTTANLRQSFFQTASNSLWANEAYLTARDVLGADTMEELVMLCDLHGVGYIQIDPETPSKSRVIIPCRQRAEIDWASVNRIAAENKDFKEFMGNVHNYLQSGQLLKPLWD